MNEGRVEGGATLSDRLHYLRGRNEALAEVAALLSADQDVLLVSLEQLAAEPG